MLSRKRLAEFFPLTQAVLLCTAIAASAPALGQDADPPSLIAAPPTPAETGNLPLPMDEVRIFAQVLSQVREAYVEPIDDKTLLENAIKGMLAGIDPHSTYLAKEDFS